MLYDERSRGARFRRIEHPWVKMCHEKKKVREIIAREEQRRGQQIDRDSLMVGEGDNAEHLDTADDIGRALHEFFRQWFREGVSSWFHAALGKRGGHLYTHSVSQ